MKAGNLNKFEVRTSNLEILGGQSLIEVLVSLGIATLFGLALVSASLITQKAARQAKNNAQATKLAQENIEEVRVFRDRKGFSAFPADNLCLVLVGTEDPNPVNWTLPACTGDGESVPYTNIVFTRKIAIAASGADKKLITVTVTWSESGETRIVSNQTYLGRKESF